MHVKREISSSNMNSVSDSIKRLAISHDGHPVPQPPAPGVLALQVPGPDDARPILSVMSNARDDFMSRYDIVREIGKGGFSTVYQCRKKGSDVDYAVKVIDLRPLRLRERFNPTRLKREVEIMRKLKHPNIIQFIEVYEDPDYLMMVLEYCPGVELFEVILARKFLPEDAARPIFAQVALALFYLHSLSIMHRDIKPENILIGNAPDPVTGAPVAKLLDFGLSKFAGVGGSLAKTFVGTPCYLAPEVEQTSKGVGTYGLPADCWSLGAVLYVMLVARFPEFERDFSGKVVVKLPHSLWGNVSNDAKDLVRSLMNTNANARITMANVLQHPWMGQFRKSKESVERLNFATYYLGRNIQEEEDRIEAAEKRQREQLQAMSTPKKGAAASASAVDESAVEITANGAEVHHRAMVVRPNPNHGRGNKMTSQKIEAELAPLLYLQRDIAVCFEEAHEAFLEFPEVAGQVRKGATLCREQLKESTKMLGKVEQTARLVLNMFPDLELAMEEGEPRLAAHFFGVVKTWIADLRVLVASTQTANKASMEQIQEIVEKSTSGLQAARKKASSTITMPKNLLDVMLSNLKIGKQLQIENGTGSVDSLNVSNASDENIELDANQIMELFMSLFGVQQSSQTSPVGARVSSIDSEASMDLDRRNTASPLDVSAMASAANSAAKESRDRGLSGAAVDVTASGHKERSGTIDISSDTHKTRSGTIDISKINSQGSTVSLETEDTTLTSDPRLSGKYPKAITNGPEDSSFTAKSPRAANRLTEALAKLREVDRILDQLNVFWTNTEMVLDMLTKTGQHVEQFIEFAAKPKLLARFRERVEEYKRFWEGVSMMCYNYVHGVNGGGSPSEASTGTASTAFSDHEKMYGFLEKEVHLAGESIYKFPDVTPPRNTFQGTRFEAATPPTVPLGSSSSRVEEAHSFDSLGGVFKTINSSAGGRPM